MFNSPKINESFYDTGYPPYVSHRGWWVTLKRLRKLRCFLNVWFGRVSLTVSSSFRTPVHLWRRLVTNDLLVTVSEESYLPRNRWNLKINSYRDETFVWVSWVQNKEFTVSCLRPNKDVEGGTRFKQTLSSWEWPYLNRWGWKCFTLNSSPRDSKEPKKR